MNEVIEGNKIIAEFMGKITGIGIPLSTFNNYHTSWDCLMPVVEKISRIELDRFEDVIATAYPRTFGMLSHDGKAMVRLNRSSLFEAETLIEATWLAVIDFINWYNTQE